MDISISYPRQRVPMVSASILEYRTRPAPGGTPATRRRDTRSSTWATEPATGYGRQQPPAREPSELG